MQLDGAAGMAPDLMQMRLLTEYTAGRHPRRDRIRSGVVIIERHPSNM
jgi:hypothetical protein